MGFTSRTQKYRFKIHQDPEKLKKYREKERERGIKRRKNQKTNMDSEALLEQRRKNTERQRKYREKKKKSDAFKLFSGTETCSDSDATHSYHSNSQYNSSPCSQQVLYPYYAETEFLPFTHNNLVYNQPEGLPSTQEIRQIEEVNEVAHRRKLENKHRTKIAKAVIIYILKSAPERKLVREDFMQLTNSIIEIFPHEVKETYYVPFTKGRLARGKLFDAYNNTKSRLRAAGVLRKPAKPPTTIDNQSTTDSILSLSVPEPGSALASTFSQPKNSPDYTLTHLQTKVKLENTTPSFETASYDNEVEQDRFLFNTETELPTTEEIKQICEIQDLLQVQTFENKHRKQVAKAVISLIQQSSPDRRIARAEFLQLAQSIVDIFPSESKETYYIPSQKGSLSKGKLYDTYHNFRTRLHAAGVIRKRYRTAKSAENTNICDNAVQVDESDLEILKSECPKWDLVFTAWIKSHNFRQIELRKENFTTIDYLEKYKVLLNENNYELFHIDFKMLYPGSKDIYEWKKYYLKIIAKAQKVHDSRVKEMLADIKNTQEEDSKLALSFMLMPYLLTNHRKRTKLEILESFICLRKKEEICPGEIKNESINDADSENPQTIESEPKIYLISGCNSIIDHAYVDICGKRLKFNNPMKAIETCFHCFLTMNIKYPNYCAHIWAFIQELLFEITTPWDIPTPSITTLVNDLK